MTNGKDQDFPVLCSVLIFCLGLGFGVSLGAVWLQKAVDWVFGYTWNYETRCIVESPRKTDIGVGKFCRLPQDCKKCNTVSDIDDVHIDDISPEKFKQKYFSSARPLVVRNASLAWPALQVVSFPWLRAEYLKLSAMRRNYQTGNCQFLRFGPAEEVRTLRNLFTLSEEKMQDNEVPWFVGFSLCYKDMIEKLLTLYERPAFLPNRTADVPWIFAGSPGSGMHFHIKQATGAFLDAPGASWHAQLSGAATWYLRPPPECSRACHGIMQTTLFPGDLIVFDPTIWFHSAKVHTPEEISLSVGHEV